MLFTIEIYMTNSLDKHKVEISCVFTCYYLARNDYLNFIKFVDKNIQLLLIDISLHIFIVFLLLQDDY